MIGFYSLIFFLLFLQGAKIIQSFMWYLNPRQVFDLSQGGPKEGYALRIVVYLTHMHNTMMATQLPCLSDLLFASVFSFPSLEMYRKVHNLRILACGGDGTVSPCILVLLFKFCHIFIECTKISLL